MYKIKVTYKMYKNRLFLLTYIEFYFMNISHGIYSFLMNI